MYTPTNIDKIPVLTNELSEPRKSPIDVQDATVGDVITLIGIDRQTHDSFKDSRKWLGVVVRVIKEPRNFEYSQRVEMENLYKNNITPIRYKVCLLDGPYVNTKPETYDLTPEDKRIIDSLDDYSLNPKYNGILTVGSKVWIAQENYKDKVIQYSNSKTINVSVSPNSPPSTPQPNVGFNKPSPPINNPILNAMDVTLIPEAQREEDLPDNKDKKWTPPLNGTYKITSLVGLRPNPTNPSVMGDHAGIDIAAPIGTPIYAVADGKVSIAHESNDNNCGIFVNLLVKDDNIEYKITHCHMSKLTVKTGQKVNKGNLLGLVGNTGGSTGPHLHFQMKANGKLVNPYDVKKIKDIFPEEIIYSHGVFTPT